MTPCAIGPLACCCHTSHTPSLWGRQVACVRLLIGQPLARETPFSAKAAACRYVAQDGRRTLWVRPIGNRPAAYARNTAPASANLSAECISLREVFDRAAPRYRHSPPKESRI